MLPHLLGGCERIVGPSLSPLAGIFDELPDNTDFLQSLEAAEGGTSVPDMCVDGLGAETRAAEFGGES